MIKSISKQRSGQMREYAKVKAAFMKEHPRCQACESVRQLRPKPAIDVHHKRGRVGRLLCDDRHFLAVCRHCHDWIHGHPKEALELGLRAGAGEWNKYED